jgi:hypothetical protein
MSIAPTGKSETGDPLLLTPGPLTTSKTTKQAMVHDWGSRDATFLAANASMLKRIAALAGRADSHVTVPVQGSGTFAVEAMITSMVPRNGKLLLAIRTASRGDCDFKCSGMLCEAKAHGCGRSRPLAPGYPLDNSQPLKRQGWK